MTTISDLLKLFSGLLLIVAVLWLFHFMDKDILERFKEERFKEERQKEEAYLLKQKNKLYNIVQLEQLEGRVKSIKSENGVVLVTVKEVDDLEEVIIPTYDASSVKLQTRINFFYVSIVRNNSDYRNGFILPDDYNVIARVNDEHGLLMYNIFNHYFPQEHKEY